MVVATVLTRLVRAAGAMAVGAVLAVAPRAALAHPLHTTLAELSHDPRSGVVSISLRLFADDFAAAVIRTSKAPGHGAAAAPSDSAMFRYVSERFSLAAPGRAGGGQIALRWCGLRRSGDVVFVCLRGAGVGPLSGVRVLNRLMTEVFDDQVNMVQAVQGGRRQMLLFTKRDGSKLLA